MTLSKTHRLALYVGAFLFFVIAVPEAHALDDISSYESDVTIRKDGTVTIVEEIVYDFGTEERHGIYRQIPTSHPQPASAKHLMRAIDYEVILVERDGVPEPHTVKEDREELFIRVGDPDLTITGAHTYRITYKLRGALTYDHEGVTEFYYNVTGNEWIGTIQNASALVRDPDGILGEGYACYEGAFGSDARCITSLTEEGVRFEAADLMVGEGMTIAVAVDPSVARIDNERVHPRYIFWGIIVPIVLLCALILGVRVYRLERFYRKSGTVVAQYEPYPGVLPMYTGVLVDESLDHRDISAGIVYLAEQGYLRITRTEKTFLGFKNGADFEVELLKEVTPDAPERAHEILSLMFASSETQDGEGLRAFAPGTKTLLSEVKKNESRRAENAATIARLTAAVIRDARTLGFFEHIDGRSWVLIVAIMLASLALYIWGTLQYVWADGSSDILAICVGAMILVLYVGYLVMLIRRRTTKGYEALNHLKGFKLFLSVTDAKRLEFHNAPEKNPELFMRYLPYAIALGVEARWAEVFKDITLPQPSWYQGDAHAFSAVALADGLHGFSSSLTAASARPSSSGSGSGSGGGGFSGGGGGGGGGGSW